MNLKLNETARELGKPLSNAVTIAEGTLMLLDDAAEHHGGGDARCHAFRALVEQIRAEVIKAADAYETIADALQEQR